jgi:hypothetical protein
MKQRLRMRGYSNLDIFIMTPQEARDILNDPNRKPDPTP